MKFLPFILFSFSVAVSQNLPDTTIVFVLGTVHYFDPSHKQDFEKDINIICKFKPEIICSEVVPPYDTASLNAVRVSHLRKADSLRALYGLNEQEIDSLLAVTSKLIEKNKNGPLGYENLAFLYYLKNDFLGNSDYNWYKASKTLGSDSGVAEQFKSKELFNRFVTRSGNGEYYNIIFPAASKLNIRSIYTFDYRADEIEFLKLTNKLQSRMAWGILLFQFNGIRLFKVSNKLKTYYNSYEVEGKLLKGVNSVSYQNLLSGVVDNLYPKWSQKEYAKRAQFLWNDRNERMASRIVDAIKTTNAKRVLVTLGAAHVQSITKLLRKAGYKVMTYDDVENHL